MNGRFLLFVLFCFLGGLAHGQSQTMLTGKIFDSAGANFSGCQVHVAGCDKMDSSDRDGVYRIFLVPGKYKIDLFRAAVLLQHKEVEVPPVEFYEVDFVLGTFP